MVQKSQFQSMLYGGGGVVYMYVRHLAVELITIYNSQHLCEWGYFTTIIMILCFSAGMAPLI